MSTVNKEVYQPAPVVNYPNEHAYTRVTEFKYLTEQEHAKTSVVYEYPCAHGDPYYPVPRPENAEVMLPCPFSMADDETPLVVPNAASALAPAKVAGNGHANGKSVVA